MKNLHDLSGHPSPFNVSIIPRPLPSEVMEGEHFVVANLLSLITDGSSLAREMESEVAGRKFVISTQPAQPSSTSEDSGPALRVSWQGKGSARLECPPLVRKDSHLAP